PDHRSAAIRRWRPRLHRDLLWDRARTYTHADTDSFSNTNSHAYANCYHYSYGYADGDTYFHAEADADTPRGTHTKGSSNAGTETVEISCARHVSLGRHDTLSMTAMCVSNLDCLPVGIHG